MSEERIDTKEATEAKCYNVVSRLMCSQDFISEHGELKSNPCPIKKSANTEAVMNDESGESPQVSK